MCSRLARRLPSWVEDTSDIPPDLPGVLDVADVLVGKRVRVFHAARLLSHEVVEIQAGGLSVLTLDLQARKLDAARDRRYISSQDAERLRAARALRGAADFRRAAMLWAAASMRPFDRSPHGVRRLLPYWGGEGMYRAHEGTDLGAKLLTLGTPTLVRCTVAVDPAKERWSPSLAQVLVGTRAGFDDVGADVKMFESAPTASIEGCSQPDDPEYDTHPLLPRT